MHWTDFSRTLLLPNIRCGLTILQLKALLSLLSSSGRPGLGKFLYLPKLHLLKGLVRMLPALAVDAVYFWVAKRHLVSFVLSVTVSLCLHVTTSYKSQQHLLLPQHKTEKKVINFTADAERLLITRLIPSCCLVEVCKLDLTKTNLEGCGKIFFLTVYSGMLWYGPALFRSCVAGSLIY